MGVKILSHTWWPYLESLYRNSQKKKLSSFVVSTVPDDALAPLGTKTSAGTVMINFGFLNGVVCPSLERHHHDITIHTLQWRHYERHGFSDCRHLDCLLKRLFRRTSKKISKLRVTGLCEGNPPVTGGFPSQRANNAEDIFIWWRHVNMTTPHMHESWKDTAVYCCTDTCDPQPDLFLNSHGSKSVAWHLLLVPSSCYHIDGVMQKKLTVKPLI